MARDESTRRVVDGVALAEFLRERARAAPDPSTVARSARNRLVGLVTRVLTGKVMAQVEVQCGPHRVVALMSTEAVHELGLVSGVLAVAVIKSTDIVVEAPTRPPPSRGHRPQPPDQSASTMQAMTPA